jgi:uncharacterized phiE125 gp8 family phage protein
MLVNRAPDGSALPVPSSATLDHIRAPMEDLSAVETIIRTAAAEIEHFAQIALLTQTVGVTIFAPSPCDGLHLPVGPVLDGDTPTVTIDGTAFTGFDFVAGLRPYLRWHDDFHSLTPKRIDLTYQAGFGDDETDVPPDLAQALMDQAALHYDGRSPMDAKSLTASPHMARIAARYRGVQV